MLEIFHPMLSQFKLAHLIMRTLIGSESVENLTWTCPGIFKTAQYIFASRLSMVTSTLVEGALYSASIQLKGLILAQNERWRRGLGMQVEREV